MNMITQPRIVTDGWQEIADFLQETGYFADDQLNPEIAPRILADSVRQYTTNIGYAANRKLIAHGEQRMRVFLGER